MNTPRSIPAQSVAVWRERARKELAQAWMRWGWLAIIVLAAWMILANFPAGPPPEGPELDESWTLALNLAHAQGLVAGKDLIWTYGPLGYLSSPGPAAGGKWVPLAYILGTYALWALAVIRLRHRPWMVLLLGLAALIDPFVSIDHLEMAVYAVALLVLADDPRRRDGNLGLLAFLAGVSVLGKESQGLQAAAMLACLMGARFWQERNWKLQIVAPAGVLAVTVFGLYWAFTGDPGSLGQYFRTSWEVISGYSENMSTPGEAWQIVLALAMLATLVIWIPAIAEDRKKLLPAVPLAGVCAFLVFKNAIVRQGPAHFVSFAPKMLLASLFLLALAEARRSRRMLVAFQAGCLIFGYWFAVASWPQTPWQTRQRLSLVQSFAWMRVFLHWPQNWKELELESTGNLSVFRVSPMYRAEIGEHSVDSVPWDVGQVRGNGWTWRPQPVFQSYQAYTPALDAIDAEHLKSNASADFLLVSWKAIDGRNPFLEEPLTWQERLNRYETDLHDRSLLLMKRRAEARFPAPASYVESPTRIGWDQVIEVPDARGVEARIWVEKSLRGSVRAALFRLNPLWMVVKRQSGKVERWRLVRANLRDGVRLRELPRGLGDVTLLGQAGCSIDDPVVSFVLHTENRADYDPAIRLQWGWGGGEEQTPCVQLAETQALVDVTGGSGTVKVDAGDNPKWEVKSNAGWTSAEPASGGFRYTVEPNLAAASRAATITVNGLNFSIFQAGVSAWTGLFRPRGSLAVFTFGKEETFSRMFGEAGDQPVVGDWTGNGVTRIGVFRKGGWFLDLNNNGKWDGIEGGDAFYAFGVPGDRAVVGDWNGDGTSKMGVYREGQWVLDFNGTHKYDPRIGVMRAFHFGLPADIPVVSNWRHTGRADQVGVFREGMWFVDSNGDGKYESGVDDLYPFGMPGDIPVVVDWGKFGGKKIGVYRKGLWVLDRNGDNRYDAQDLVFASGEEGDVPLAGHWK